MPDSKKMVLGVAAASLAALGIVFVASNVDLPSAGFSDPGTPATPVVDRVEPAPVAKPPPPPAPAPSPIPRPHPAPSR